MVNTVYDTGFNLNEWFVIFLFLGGVIVIVILPKLLSLTESIFNFLMGITVGLMFDHTIAVPPFDLYDLGDASNYQYFDVFSYCMYAPFGYIFITLYKMFHLKGLILIPYVVLWSGLGIFIEWIGVKVGLFHYKNGYHLIFSLPIYLTIQSLHLYLNGKLFNNKHA